MTTTIDTYDRLPIGIYEQICAVVDSDPDGDDARKDLEIIALLSGCTADELLDIPIDEFRARRDAAAFLTVQPPKAKVKKLYAIGGRSCVPCSDVRRMTAGQFLDFQDIAARKGTHDVELISCLLVPEGTTYGKDYDVWEFQEQLRRDLSVTDAVALVDFFAAGSMRSSARTRRSLARTIRRIKARTPELARMKKEAGKALRALPRAGAGSAAYTVSPSLPARLGRRCAKWLLSSFSTSSVTPTTGTPSAPVSSANNSGAGEGDRS